VCGIAGRVGTEPLPAEEITALLGVMIRKQAARGPDGSGIHVSGSGKSGLAHTRLAILDCSILGAQPMESRFGGLWITFNGEIYNFPELRKELEREGAVFRSRSDTEVILALFSRHGVSSFRMLRGMFAFGLLDEREGDLFLVRDRFGIKPLYYWESDGEILFASEVRALVASGRIPIVPDPAAAPAFLLTGSVPSPMTTVRDVRSVPPVQYLQFAHGKPSIHRYYSSDYSSKVDLPPAEARITVRRLLEEAVISHLISDAPLGLFLSGGVDSSLLTALAASNRPEPVTTLSVNFREKEFDEEPFQALVARRYATDHRKISVTPDRIMEMLPAFFESMDQPTIDGLNTYVVSWAAGQAGLKAVLSGLGADEIFGGYEVVAKYPLVKKLQRVPLLAFGASRVLGALNRKYLRLQGDGMEGTLEAYLACRGMFGASELVPTFGKDAVEEAIGVLVQSARWLTSSDPMDEVAEMEFRYFLLNQLLKDSDVMGMAHSIEIRVPFLDHPFVDFVASLPPRVRYRKGSNKALLAESCGDLLPEEIWTRRKQGFTFPLDSWLRGPLGDELKRVRFSDDRLQQSFRCSLDGFLSGREHWSRPYAWFVLMRFLPAA